MKKNQWGMFEKCYLYARSSKKDSCKRNMVSEKIEYIIMLIKLFARHFGLSYQQAYRYVSQHGGIEYAERHYSVLHTLPFQDQVEGLTMYCHKNGGDLI